MEWSGPIAVHCHRLCSHFQEVNRLVAVIHRWPAANTRHRRADELRSVFRWPVVVAVANTHLMVLLFKLNYFIFLHQNCQSFHRKPFWNLVHSIWLDQYLYSQWFRVKMLSMAVDMELDSVVAVPVDYTHIHWTRNNDDYDRFLFSLSDATHRL